MKRKFLSITLAICMITSILPITGLAAENTYSDTSGHWANAAIERWSDYGVLSGYNGQFRPSDPITRAELASVLDKVMRYQGKSYVADFSDIDASAWYAPAILKLNAASIMLGSDGKMRPNDSITREEAAVMIGRAFAVPENSGNENPFPDADDISGWASFLVDGMKAAGYISGYPDGSFGPKNTITRAEVVTILDKMVDYFYHEPGEADNEGISFSPKNVVINTSGVTLKNTVVTGDLYIAPGVGSGEVTLENVTVSGTTYIWGGGPNSVIATDCDFNTIRLDAATNPALKFSPDTKAVQVYLDNTATVTHGGVTVKYDAATDTLTFGGTIDKVTLNADGTATMTIGGIIYDVIPPEGTVSKFELGKDAVVKDMVLNAPVDVGGEGKIDKMEVHTNGVVIDKGVDVKPENITVDKDVKIKIGDKEYTGDGKTLPPSNPPSSGGGGGGTTQTQSAAPTAGVTSAAKTSATQASVNFTLTSAPTGTYKVYDHATNNTTPNGVSVNVVGTTLTLSHPTDLPTGTYYVSVTETGKTESARLALTVTAYVAPVSYNITMQDDGFGTASANPASATAGTQIEITATPTNTTNFVFDYWEIVSGGVTLSSTTTSPATFAMPGNAVTIKAHFKPTAAGIAAEAAKILATDIAAGTNNTNNLVFNITPSSVLEAGTTLNLIDTKIGANVGAAATTDLGAVLTSTTLSLNTKKTVDATDLTYVAVAFTVTLNGVTSDVRTLDISGLFGTNTTAGKLRTDKANIEAAKFRALDANVGYTGQARYNPNVQLSNGVSLTRTNHNSMNDSGATGYVSASSGGDIIVTIVTAATGHGNFSFRDVPLVCSGTQYILEVIDTSINI